jgi:hypothetical protein
LIACIEQTLYKRAVVHRAHSREHIVGAIRIGASGGLLAVANSKHGPMVEHPADLEAAER